MDSNLVLDGDFRGDWILSEGKLFGSGNEVPTSGANTNTCFVTTGGSWWRALWRKLSFCWCDPDAPPEVASAYRIRQFHALVQQAPLSSVDCAVFSLLIAWLFWAKADHALLVAWLGAVWTCAANALHIWHRYRSVTESSECERAARILTAGTTVSALLFSVIPTYLFGAADLDGKVALVAIVTAFAAHGALQNARWPAAGILWNIGMCIGVAVTLIYLYGNTYDYLAWLAVAYCAIICVSLLLISSQFVKSLMAETKINRQKQLIRLLLNDFEDDASDWLWETDQHGKLRHASSRLAEITGISPSGLRGQLLASVLVGTDGASESFRACGADQLMESLTRTVPFRNIEILAQHSGRERRWSLSGKPLLDIDGRLIGWRGVGSDITAERDLQSSREAAARVAGELDTARRIQMGLLPDLARVMADESRFSVAAILEPARQVGGDYFECFALDEKRICFAVADVSGKGVPASLFMAMTKTLSANLARRSRDLGAAISEISDELNRNNPEMFFVTTFIVVMDADSGELTCVSAGHDAPLLLRGGEVSRLDLDDAQGPPMCTMPGYRFQAVKRQLQPGDTLCLFTDGATEASNGSSFYGSQRLIETFAAQQENVSVNNHTEALRQSIREFEAGTAPVDDLTIMTLRWHGIAAA